MITNYSGNNGSWHFKLNDVCDDKFPVLLIWHRWFRMTNWILFEVNFFLEKDISFCPPHVSGKEMACIWIYLQMLHIQRSLFSILSFCPHASGKDTAKEEILKRITNTLFMVACNWFGKFDLILLPTFVYILCHFGTTPFSPNGLDAM